jgi:hypothetical protein
METTKHCYLRQPATQYRQLARHDQARGSVMGNGLAPLLPRVQHLLGTYIQCKVSVYSRLATTRKTDQILAIRTTVAPNLQIAVHIAPTTTR